jgi:serine phosphatase RsbU (regulator of sigma subunit)/catechol 2,3-dioxygenase-like lactoylglutathione lyase family enzyme
MDRNRYPPHLSIHHVDVYVTDQERSLAFMTEKLGFKLLIDASGASFGRFIAISPPDGGTIVGLVAPRPESAERALVGRAKWVVLVTDDINAKYEEWRAAGVEFAHPPRAWKAASGGPMQSMRDTGGTFTTFTDPDGNTFTLISQGDMSRQLEAQRRAAADREEAERRAAREMEIARQVQARLFPHGPPHSRTIDLAGRCLPAQEVGGDYFDFLPLGRDRLGLLVGDISGKGIAAALLMANLQASVRSQSAVAVEDPRRFLESVNRHFFNNSTAGAYATLFFGECSQETGDLRYVNCGHPAALLMRADGRIEQLPATSTVLGLFGDWECATAMTRLGDGDALVLYTDGVTEWSDAVGEEFGVERLTAVARLARELSASALLDQILRALRDFGGEGQQDDVTLLVAKRHSP